MRVAGGSAAGGRFPQLLPAGRGLPSRLSPSSKGALPATVREEGERKARSALSVAKREDKASLHRHLLLRGPGRCEAAPAAPLASRALGCSPHRLKFSASGVETLVLCGTARFAPAMAGPVDEACVCLSLAELPHPRPVPCKMAAATSFKNSRMVDGLFPPLSISPLHVNLVGREFTRDVRPFQSRGDLLEQPCHTVTPDLRQGIVPERQGQNHARERADNQRGWAIACQLRSVPGLCFVCLYKHDLSAASAETMSQLSELLNCH